MTRGTTLLDLAFGWIAAGAARLEQIEANVRAVEWKLNEEELQETRGMTSSAEL